MLAYFFFHWKRPEVSAHDYEERLRDFHAALKAVPSDGFSESWSAALDGIPWANNGGDSYEDWYLVRNSADLDPLNDAAISASRKVPHDRAAAGTAGGSAGLYRNRAGAAIVNPRFTTWFSKPDGWSYAELYERLDSTLAGGAVLWQRQMALGPGEFCLHSNVAAAMPGGIEAQPIALRSVFPERA
ncbi:MAG TPA: hypothetical protein VFZ73_06875 [Gemmatimonadaceae bacterium]